MPGSRSPQRAEDAQPWLVPVRLRKTLWIGWRRYGIGARVFVPFGKGLVMARDGRAELLLPRVHTETWTVSDPLAPPQRPDPHRGLRW